MTALATSGIVFICAVISGACGARLRSKLPENRLSAESKDVIKLAIGLVASMVALILGLLVYSAKSFYDTQSAEITKMSAQALLLDRALAHYGLEAHEARLLLRSALMHVLDRNWSRGRYQTASANPVDTRQEEIYEAIHYLKPHSELQASLRAAALNILSELGQTRWLIYEQNVVGVPRPLLGVMVIWLCFLFFTFGLFAPSNGTVALSHRTTFMDSSNFSRTTGRLSAGSSEPSLSLSTCGFAPEYLTGSKNVLRRKTSSTNCPARKAHPNRERFGCPLILLVTSFRREEDQNTCES
jgi:hypothetical protein